MNKVVTINLGGMAYQLEEGGCDALSCARIWKPPPCACAATADRDEILSDIERAIADKFRALLASHTTVVETNELAAILAEMGPIDADPGRTPQVQTQKALRVAAGKILGRRGEKSASPIGPWSEAEAAFPHRIHEGAIISGGLQRNRRLLQTLTPPLCALPSRCR